MFRIIGRKRQNDVMIKLIESDYCQKETWCEIIKYLEKELRINEQILLYENSNPKKPENSKTQNEKEKIQAHSADHSRSKKFFICEKTDHVPTNKGNLFINYFASDKFVNMSPKDRFEELKRNQFCFHCLTPGLKAKHGGNCFDKFKCPNESYKRYKSGLRVLICDQHKSNKENVDLLELYKAKYITGSGNAGNPYPDFSKNIGISFHVGAHSGTYEILDEVKVCGESE